MASNSLASAAQPVDYMCPRQSKIVSLLVRVGDGDRDAFASLYDELSQTVYAMSLRRGHEPRLSAEVTHDVFLRAWRQARTYDPKTESAWAWFHAMALEAINSRMKGDARLPCGQAGPHGDLLAQQR